MKKAFICILLSFISLVNLCFASDISAKSALLYDCFSDSVLYERAANAPLPMASTTKIMTGIIACEIYDPEQSVTIKPEWCGIEGSSMYLAPGETMKIKDLLYGLLLMSGNDAAVALASVKTGNISDFVYLMNEKAKELFMTDTHFTNPSGLDDELHYTTANDLCKLTDYALQNPLFASVCATKQAQIAGRFMANHNKLLFTLKGASGVKTGYTDTAGRCLVSSVVRNGRRLIAVTLNDPDDWKDHESLYSNAFSDMSVCTIVKKGIVGKAYVAGKGNTSVYLSEEISAFLTEDELSGITLSLTAPRIVYGYVKSGDKYGTLHVFLNGREIASKPVFFKDNVEYFKPKVSLWDKLF